MESWLRQRRPHPLRLEHPLHPEKGSTVEERRRANIANLETKLNDPAIRSSFTER